MSRHPVYTITQSLQVRRYSGRDMVTPCKLFKKVIFFLHAAIITSTFTYMSLPGLPVFAQQIANLYFKNLIELGTELMIKFNKVGDILINWSSGGIETHLSTSTTHAEIHY